MPGFSRLVELETVFHTVHRGTHSAHFKDAANFLVEHAKAPSTIVVSVFTLTQRCIIETFSDDALSLVCARKYQVPYSLRRENQRRR